MLKRINTIIVVLYKCASLLLHVLTVLEEFHWLELVVDLKHVIEQLIESPILY